jgi:transcriptional regulator with XRE-family HTH domain
MDGFDKRVAEQLGRRVKRRRNFLDLSQEALAERAGIHRTLISLYEHGQRMPLTSTLIKLAAGLGVSADQLSAGSSGRSPDTEALPRPGLAGTRAPTMPQRRSDLVVAERFGENLRRVRKREDLSQEKLAKRASLHRTEIGLLEKGERVCRIDTLIRLAGGMAVPPGELLEGIDWVSGRETFGTFVLGGGPPAATPSGGEM